MGRFVFRNYGGIYQLRLDRPEDLGFIQELAKARFCATSAPIDQLYCDAELLRYLDTDQNGRIRVHELRAAQAWLFRHLRVRDRLTDRKEELHLADLDTSHKEGQKMLELAERMLEQLQAPRRDVITLAEIRKFRDSYRSSFPNGDGVVPPEEAGNPEVEQIIRDVIASAGGTQDLSGKQGIRREDFDAYRARAASYLAWKAEAALPFGEDTAPASALVDELNQKMEHYFSLCDLVRLEQHAAGRLQATPEVLAALDIRDPEAIAEFLRGAPLAQPRADGVLDLGAPINPLYADAVLRLGREVLPRVLGQAPGTPKLTRREWTQVREAFAAYRAWQARRPEGVPETIPDDRLRKALYGPLVEKVHALLARDLEVAEGLARWNDLEKLVLLKRWFLELCNNFVSFPALFDPSRQALFVAGSLILDGRELDFCVKVDDRDAHKKIAEGAKMFLLYAELTRKVDDREEKMVIASAVTAGTRGGIEVGKRGVFYDRNGDEWDAVVVDVITHPISLFEAAVAPFRRVREMIVERIEKFASSKVGGLDALASQQLAKAEKAVAGGPPAGPPAPKPPAPPPAGGLQGMLVGGSVAVAALGSSLAFVLKMLSDIHLGQLLAAVMVVSLAVLVFSAFLGWLKLRRRDLSTVLEACGWAINVRMRLRRQLSRLFTRTPGLPPLSIRERTDMVSTFANQVGDMGSPWLRYLLLFIGVLVIAAAIYAHLEQLYLRNLMKQHGVLGALLRLMGR